MSSPISLSFTQGETIQIPITIKDSGGTPKDLSGYTFKSDVRKEYTTGVVASFTIVEVDLANGSFRLDMSSPVSEALPVNTTGRVTSFVFDLDMYAPGSPQIIETPLSGYLKIAHRVTANV